MSSPRHPSYIIRAQASDDSRQQKPKQQQQQTEQPNNLSQRKAGGSNGDAAGLLTMAGSWSLPVQCNLFACNSMEAIVPQNRHSLLADAPRRAIVPIRLLMANAMIFFCNNERCLFDGFDCLERPQSKCPWMDECARVYADGHCDEQCNQANCGWDQKCQRVGSSALGLRGMASRDGGSAGVEYASPLLLLHLLVKMTSPVMIKEKTRAMRRPILDPNDSSLLYNGRKVAIIYQVNFISEKDWRTETEWDIRRKLERSTAILTSNAHSELASSKKVQQVLALPGMLERFLPDVKEEIVQSIRKTFAGLWGLDNDDAKTRAVIKRAIEHPEKFVLKKNGDGGGNNFWDNQLAEQLRTLSQKERAGLILMEKLEPLRVTNYSIRPRQATSQFESMTGELGIIGYFLGNAKTMGALDNAPRGYVLRTKPADAREGGIGTGIGVLDSPLLF
ncbi:hypothetical protein GPALN_002320 [Globodera pallida]|nr:hypothetical protein GPALN_002320 [Globodera pallida]